MLEHDLELLEYTLSKKISYNSVRCRFFIGCKKYS
jgi:hypothetical protein